MRLNTQCFKDFSKFMMIEYGLELDYTELEYGDVKFNPEYSHIAHVYEQAYNDALNFANHAYR